MLLPDVRGLHPFYEDLARRFAEAGFTTLAIDLYGRTTVDGVRGDAFDWRDHVDQVCPDQVDADVGVALEYLRSHDPGPAFTVGFCFGGGQSWRLAGSNLPLVGAVGFYGLPYLVTGAFDQDRAPVLMLLAGRDEETPSWEFDDLIARFEAAGAPCEFHVYTDAPHSYFDRCNDQWADVCWDSWRRVLSFTDQHGQGTQPVPEPPAERKR